MTKMCNTTALTDGSALADFRMLTAPLTTPGIITFRSREPTTDAICAIPATPGRGISPQGSENVICPLTFHSVVKCAISSQVLDRDKLEVTWSILLVEFLLHLLGLSFVSHSASDFVSRFQCLLGCVACDEAIDSSNEDP